MKVPVKKPTLTLCMVVKDEELLLPQCLKSIKSIVDEIVIVDTGSKDRTIEIARKFGAVVIKYKDAKNLGKARNVCIRMANSSWILLMDPDERIARRDLFKLKMLTYDAKVSGYLFAIRDYSRQYDLICNWYPNDGKYPDEDKFSECPGWRLGRMVRLFRKEAGFSYREGYSRHAYFLTPETKCENSIKESDVVIHHFQYLKGKNFINRKHTNYLNNELKEIRIFRDNPWSYLNLGISFFSLHKDQEAAKYLKKALAIDSEFKMAYLVLGMVYREMKKYNEASFFLKKAIRIDPDYADAWAVLGMVYNAENRHAEAEVALKKAISINSGHLLAHNNLGVLYHNQARLMRAKKEYERAIKINPYYSDTYYNLGLLYQEKSNFSQAAKCYSMVLDIDPKDKDARARLKSVLKASRT